MMRIMEEIDIVELRKQKQFIVVGYSKVEKKDKPLYMTGWSIGYGPKISNSKIDALRFGTVENAKRFLSENIKGESEASAKKIVDLATIFIVEE